MTPTDLWQLIEAYAEATGWTYLGQDRGGVSPQQWADLSALRTQLQAAIGYLPTAD